MAGCSKCSISHMCEQFKYVADLQKRVEKLEKKFKDLEKEVDTGTHEDGLGWNAKGLFCGECTAKTCLGCEYEYAKHRERKYK